MYIYLLSLVVSSVIVDTAKLIIDNFKIHKAAISAKLSAIILETITSEESV